MNVAYILLIVFGVISSATSDLIIPEQDYKLLPPIFHIDAYDQCLGKGNTFCKVSLKLSPSSTTSKSWKIISETKKSREHYNHDELYHAICMDEKYNVHKNVTVLEKAISKLYTQKYKHLDLKATVIDLNCHNYQYHLKMFDVVLMSFIVAYLLLIVFATVYDVTALRKTNKCITSFSLYHNLTELKRKYQQTDFHKLKCIQGIRFYTTVLIIFCHTFCSFSGGFVANTKYFEEIPQNSLRHGLRNLFVFLVQTFFLISAWLLSYHTFHIFEHAERMHFLKYVWLTFSNRYLRIIPPVLLMVSLGSSIWIYGSFHGPVKDIYSDKEYQRCQENWWIIFLFLNNHYQQHDMCYFTTWYLSADTQLYALSIIILIIIFKLKYSNILLLAICVTIGVTIPSTVSYLYNLDFIYRITPDNGQYLAVYDYNDRSKKYCVLARRDFSTFLHTRIISWYTLTFPSDHHFDLTRNNTTPYFNENKSKNSKNNMFRSFEFNATYTSTYSNMATYTLGLLFGYIYYRLENKPFFTNKLHIILWWTTSLGLPLTVIIISSYEYGQVTRAVLAGTLKPMYALGIGMAIFGMSHRTGGIIKVLCEWKPALFLGNITYSTYVVHFGIVFCRTALTMEPLQVSDSVLLFSFIQDALLSFICGFVMHLLLEMPMSQLQSIFVPKFRADVLKFDNDKRIK